MFKLVIQDDEGKTTVVPLIRDEITIGRKEGNTIRLTERNVSRRHARIERANGSVLIEDLDSYNGVLVNGSRVQGRASLSESDRVQIGDYLIELKTDAEKGAIPPGQQTQPMERVDPMGNTPVPEPMAEAGSEAATVPVQTTSPTAPQPVQKPAFGGANGANGANGKAAAAPAAPPVSVSATPSAAAHALADTDPGLSTASTSDVSRLVVLSSNFAGQEFPLDKPASVIGRTDDNDVVVNHRSISRHHAKIVQEQGRFAIVDLQSSNGVRVNGEEYGKVELRRGDVVDLGHVRLRFVEAGEDFLLGRDAQIVDLSAEAGGGRRGLLWLAIAVIVLGAIALFALTRGGKDADQAASKGTSQRAGTDPNDLGGKQPPIDTDTPPAVDDADAAIVEPTGSDVSDRLAAAREALDAEKWADMQGAANEALEIDPSNAEARKLKAQAERELRNELLYSKFSTAVAKNQPAGVALLFAKLDDESVYRVKAQADHDRMRDEYIAAMTKRADSLASGSKCKDLKRLERDAGRVWPEAGTAVTPYVTRGCAVAKTGGSKTGGSKTGGSKTGGTTKTGGGSDDDGGSKTGGGSDDDSTAAAGPKKSADELANEAGATARKGNYGRALKLCEDALDAKPSHPHARMVCTISACMVGNAKKAKRHYAKLSSGAKRLAYSQCAKAGIKLD